MNPSKMTNEALAQGLELWVSIEDEKLFEPQKEYFNEIIWRLRLMTDVEKENIE